jgi:serine/threonine protein kinase
MAALQTIARLAIPDLVPTIERYGTTTTADGRNVDFSVTKFIHNTVTLESVWDDLEEGQQARIVKELLEAVKKLHAIRLSDSTVVKILEGTGFAPPSSESRAIVIGGPSTGYFTDIPGFLGSIIRSHSHLSSDSATGNITIHSKHDDINPVLIPSDDLQHLQDSVVLCHDDLEPRNILVQSKELANGTTSYFIAAIIDWEMSGFFPFSYEYVRKDLNLGNSNLYFTWYALFKEHGAPLVPMSPLPTSHASFMEAIELIHYSWEQGKQPMSCLITKKWIAREGVVRQQPAGTGWLKKDGRRSKRVSQAEMDEIVDQILKERAQKRGRK